MPVPRCFSIKILRHKLQTTYFDAKDIQFLQQLLTPILGPVYGIPQNLASASESLLKWLLAFRGLAYDYMYNFDKPLTPSPPFIILSIKTIHNLCRKILTEEEAANLDFDVTLKEVLNLAATPEEIRRFRRTLIPSRDITATIFRHITEAELKNVLQEFVISATERINYEVFYRVSDPPKTYRIVRPIITLPPCIMFPPIFPSHVTTIKALPITEEIFGMGTQMVQTNNGLVFPDGSVPQFVEIDLLRIDYNPAERMRAPTASSTHAPK